MDRRNSKSNIGGRSIVVNAQDFQSWYEGSTPFARSIKQKETTIYGGLFFLLTKEIKVSARNQLFYFL